MNTKNNLLVKPRERGMVLLRKVHEKLQITRQQLREKCICQQAKGYVHYSRLQRKLQEESGQGTTEYAILVGVLVVIAIIAITLFRPKIQELWTAIADGINSL